MDGAWRSIYRAGAAAAVAVLALVPVQMFVFVWWPPPSSVADWFALFQRLPLVGLVDMDLLMIVDNLLLGLTFLALVASLAPANRALVAVAAVAELLAIAAYFASNPAFEMLALSRRYAAATTDVERVTALGAGEAMLATWQGSAFNVSYLLGAAFILIISWVMLRSAVFGRATAFVGLVFGVLSLVPASAGRTGFILSLASLIPMWIWLILIARRLFQLGGARAPADALLERAIPR